MSAAGRAVQYITLSGGAWPEAFGAQLSSLKCIRDYVGSVFGVHVEDAAHNPGTIHFHRPVFTSVSVTSSRNGNHDSRCCRRRRVCRVFSALETILKDLQRILKGSGWSHIASVQLLL